MSRLEACLIFCIALLANMAAAWWLTFVWQLGNGDALSRTANGYYVLFSRDPHMGAIGFVWPPLPSLLQLPLLPFARLAGHPEFAGPIVTSLLGAGSLLLLGQILHQLGLGRMQRWLLLALTQLNPVLWYLAAIGTAEVSLLFCLLLALLGYLKMPVGVRPVIIAGLGLAMGVFVRYESLGFVAGMVMAVVIQKWPPWHNWEKALEGRLLALLIPPAYALFLWSFWNWMIMGDPLYFQRSVYSLASAPDVARNVGPDHPLYSAMGNLWLAFVYTAKRLTQANAAFPAAVLMVLWLALLRRDRPVVGLALLLLSVPVFTGLQVYLGSLPPWLRYWVYATPFAAILIGAITGMLRNGARRAAFLTLCPLMLAALPLSLSAMGDPSAGMDEQRLHSYLLAPDREAELRLRDGYWAIRHDGPILADVVDEHSADGLVLADSENAFGMILASRHPERLVITSDRDFERSLANPQAYVGYLLLLDPDIGGDRAVVSRRFPGLFQEGAPWARLEHDFTDTTQHWRLYRVQRSQASSSGAGGESSAGNGGAR